jgi:deoxyadenosine/deoxycytidine kinase
MSIFVPRHPDYIKYRPLRGSIIALEGIVGVGKSTAGRSLAAYLEKIGFKTRYYPEFRNDKYLNLYISNMLKHAFGFQMFMLRTRLSIYTEALAFAEMGGIAIVDRSLAGDYAFALMQKNKGFFDEEEWESYISVVEEHKAPSPDLVLYLKCTPEIGFERMKIRNISSEVSGYTLEYFYDLTASYQETMASLHAIEAEDISTDEKSWEDVVDLQGIATSALTLDKGDKKVVPCNGTNLAIHSPCVIYDWSSARETLDGILLDDSSRLLLNVITSSILKPTLDSLTRKLN